MDKALEMLRDFPNNFSVKSNKHLLPKDFSSIVFSGMGGSGVVGDIMKVYLEKNGCEKPVFTIKSYELLPYIKNNALLICISYSGNTEETISVYEEAIKNGIRPICISSGGALKELSQKYDTPFLELPKGYPPRYALGFMLNECLSLFGKEEEIIDLIESLKEKTLEYEERSKDIAKRLFSYIPVIYGTPLTSVCAFRFKTQINENSKTPAYWHFLPELHHNELVGYSNKELNDKLNFIIIADQKEHHRIALRVQITLDILKEKGYNPILISEEGNSFISRLLKNIYLCDFASYHLANLYGFDPIPVDIIETLKKKLSEAK